MLRVSLVQDLWFRERKARLLFADGVNVVVEGQFRVDVYTRSLALAKSIFSSFWTMIM